MLVHQYESLTGASFFRDYEGPLEVVLIHFWLDAQTWSDSGSGTPNSRRLAPPHPRAVYEKCLLAKERFGGRRPLGNAILLTWNAEQLRAWTCSPINYHGGHADGGDQTVLFESRYHQQELIDALRERFNITEFEPIEKIRMFIVTRKE